MWFNLNGYDLVSVYVSAFFALPFLYLHWTANIGKLKYGKCN